jgi:hypothetical protein
MYRHVVERIVWRASSLQKPHAGGLKAQLIPACDDWAIQKSGLYFGHLKGRDPGCPHLALVLAFVDFIFSLDAIPCLVETIPFDLCPVP